MRAQISQGLPPQPHWAGLGAANMHNVNVTIAAAPASDDSERAMAALSSVAGVIRVEPRAPATAPSVPVEDQAFATRLWEVL